MPAIPSLPCKAASQRVFAGSPICLEVLKVAFDLFGQQLDNGGPHVVAAKAEAAKGVDARWRLKARSRA